MGTYPISCKVCSSKVWVHFRDDDLAWPAKVDFKFLVLEIISSWCLGPFSSVRRSRGVSFNFRILYERISDALDTRYSVRKLETEKIRPSFL
jgi:hypothetical protein